MSFSGQTRESREKILQAAEELFSKKGFEGTSVNEITKKAGVNKALIYYYFKSKDDILRQLLNTLNEDLKRFALKELGAIAYFIKKRYVKVDRGAVEMVNIDRAVESYIEALINKSLDFYMKRKHIFRIMVMESLKKSDRSTIMFRITDFLKNDLADVLKEKGIDVTFDNRELAERFFVGLMPMVSFALYFDSWQDYYNMSKEELKAIFIRRCKESYLELLAAIKARLTNRPVMVMG